MIVQEDLSGRSYLKPFRLLSNTAVTSIEMQAVQRELSMPGNNATANAAATMGAHNNNA